MLLLSPLDPRPLALKEALYLAETHVGGSRDSHLAIGAHTQIHILDPLAGELDIESSKVDHLSARGRATHQADEPSRNLSRAERASS